MKLKPREAEDDLYGCGDDKEGKAFLVHESYIEGEWRCDVPDPNDRLSRAWTGKGEERGYEVMFMEEVRAWSMKFPAALESTRAVETTPEGQPAVKWEPERVWREIMMMKYSGLPGRRKITGPPLCSSGPSVRTHWTLLKLVPLLATIGTEPQLSPAMLFCRGEVCVAPTSMGSVSGQPKEGGEW
jgi:hypothetical protein